MHGRTQLISRRSAAEAATLLSGAMVFLLMGCSSTHQNSRASQEHLDYHTENGRARETHATNTGASTSNTYGSQTTNYTTTADNPAFQVDSYAVAGASAVSDNNPESLRGTAWRWLHLSGPAENITVNDPSMYTIRFDADGYARVRADCNIAAGMTRVDQDRFSLNMTRFTDAPCLTASHSQRFLSALSRVDGWRVADGQLILDINRESTSMRFERAS